MHHKTLQEANEYQKIDLNEIPEVSINVQESKIEGKGKIVYIRIPYDLKFGVKVEFHQNEVIKGEIITIGGKVIDEFKTKFTNLSLLEKVEIKHRDLA